MMEPHNTDPTDAERHAKPVMVHVHTFAPPVESRATCTGCGWEERVKMPAAEPTTAA